MKVLIVTYFNQWVTHFGVELELAQIHLDKGDVVEFLSCDGCIEACQANLDASRACCETCILRRSRGMALLKPIVVEHRLGDYLPDDIVKSEGQILSGITDPNSAKTFRYEDQDLGWGALSSTIMALRDSVAESPKAKDLLKRFSKTALRSYAAVKTFLESHTDFNRVYIFNGRFACTRGAFRACQERGIPDIVIHERGSSVHKYALFGNSMPHSRKLVQDRIELAWDSAASPAERETVGRAFYEERRAGIPQAWRSFTSHQQKTLLPDGWDPSVRNILIFNSSEDEFAGIGDEWKNPVYATQVEGIRRIVADALGRYPATHFYLRMHPNLIGVANQDVDMLHAIKSSNFTLIEPDSSISTYALLDVAERVLSFGSTMGIEATFWGKTSILAGHAFYDHLNAAYVARNHEQVMELLETNLPPKPTINAVKYGYYLKSFGTPFRYWKAKGFEDGEFRGTPLRWAPANKLERMILFRCHGLGLRWKFLQDVIHACSKTLWSGFAKPIWMAVARPNSRRV